ncbi:hypothetical protein GF324_04695 [bacterium]|nr:hypothetical protein [bacterium]
MQNLEKLILAVANNLDVDALGAELPLASEVARFRSEHHLPALWDLLARSFEMSLKGEVPPGPHPRESYVESFFPGAWNESGNLLHLTAALNADSWIEPLVQMGVDVNLCDRDGLPPMVAAIHHGNASICQTLFLNGACSMFIHQPEDDPISIRALVQERGFIPAHLIDRVVHQERNGLSPLNRAVIDQDEKQVRFLLSWGASPHATDRTRFTTLHFAKILDRKDLHALLLHVES